MYKSRKCKILTANNFSNYEKFYIHLLQKVKNNWKRVGNEFLNLSDAKVHRIFTGKQKDFETLIQMAEFMQMRIEFKLIN